MMRWRAVEAKGRTGVSKHLEHESRGRLSSAEVEGRRGRTVRVKGGGSMYEQKEVILEPRDG